MLKRFLQDYIHYVSSIWNRNWPGFLRQYRVLLILVALASVADCASTISFMIGNTGLTETHPVVREICYWCGPVIGPIIGKLGQFLAVVLVSAFLRHWALYILTAVTVIYLYAAWYNIWGNQIYTPLFLRLLEPLTEI